MTEVTGRTAARGRLILSESRVLRIFSFFLFYVSQGLPYGLTTTALPVWVAANGGSAAQVASVIGMAYLPWSWKFIIAALMDRYTFLAMGRRRAWLIFAQVLMSGGFIGAALLAPGPTDIDVLLVVTFLVMAGGATQDVAVDGLAVDILPEKEQGTASAFMFGGQAVGGALAAFGAAAGLQYLGSQTTFLLFIPFLMIPTIFAIVMRERPGEKFMPWSEGQAAPENLSRVAENWWSIIKVTVVSLIKGPSLVYSLHRLAGGIVLPMWPLLATAVIGLDETAYGSMASAADLVTAVIAIGVGSALTMWIGGRRSAIVVIALFLAQLGYMLLPQGTWGTFGTFAALYGIFSLLTVLMSACTNPLRMQLCDKRVSATQFTIYNSLANLPVSAGAFLFAAVGGTDNLPQTLMVAMGVYVVAGVVYAVLRMPAEKDDVLTAEGFEEGLQPRVQ